MKSFGSYHKEGFALLVFYVNEVFCSYHKEGFALLVFCSYHKEGFCPPI